VGWQSDGVGSAGNLFCTIESASRAPTDTRTPQLQPTLSLCRSTAYACVAHVCVSVQVLLRRSLQEGQPCMVGPVRYRQHLCRVTGAFTGKGLDPLLTCIMSNLLPLLTY
jgi:hypothetical protein